MSPYWKAVAYRLYLSLQAATAIGGGAGAAVLGTLYVQGRVVAARDFACFDAEMEAAAAALAASGRAAVACTPAVREAIASKQAYRVSTGQQRPLTDGEIDCLWAEVPDTEAHDAAAAKCGIVDPLQLWARSASAWNRNFGRRDPILEGFAVIMALCVAAPVGLFAGYRWLRWVVRPPTP